MAVPPASTQYWDFSADLILDVMSLSSSTINMRFFLVGLLGLALGVAVLSLAGMAFAIMEMYNSWNLLNTQMCVTARYLS